MIPFIGIGLAALKGAGGLLKKTKIGKKVAGKLADAAGQLFSGEAKERRKDRRSERRERRQEKKSSKRTKVSMTTSSSETNETPISASNGNNLPGKASGGFMELVQKYWWIGAIIIGAIILLTMIFKKKKR